jgi:aminoglycoside phosphotransferase (APT) family kinase protein
LTTPPKRHDNELPVDEALARRLLRAQFPEFADLPLRVHHEHGTDHTLFRLGDEFVMRLPIVRYAGQQALREAKTVPFLAPQVPLTLPVPVALGEPDEGYPVHWSIVRWIDGQRVTGDNIADPIAMAHQLAGFVRALQACDASDGPPAGPITWMRGTSLKPGADHVREWIAKSSELFDLTRAAEAYEEVIAAPDWDGPPTWFHGDISGNLIQDGGRLVGLIDSGYGVGDPACDLQPGWCLFRGDARKVFFEECDLDDATILRSKGWALAPAFTGLTYYKDVPALQANAIGAIEGALAD